MSIHVLALLALPVYHQQLPVSKVNPFTKQFRELHSVCHHHIKLNPLTGPDTSPSNGLASGSISSGVNNTNHRHSMVLLTEFNANGNENWTNGADLNRNSGVRSSWRRETSLLETRCPAMNFPSMV